MRTLVLLVLFVTAGLSSARADDVYYHRAGAQWSEYETDIRECAERTARTQVNTQTAYAPGGIYGIIGAAIAQGIMAGVESHRQRKKNISYCMALRGWTPVDIDNLRTEEGEAIDVDLLLDDRIKEWFAAPTPPVGRVTYRPESLLRADADLPPPITMETAIADETARREARRAR